MITNDVQLLTQSLANYQEGKVKRDFAQKMMLFGAKFADEISKATDEKQLSQIMIKANKMSYMAGVPGLADQVSNLGKIKAIELSETKKDLNAAELSKAYQENLGDMPTIIDGKAATLKDLSEFQAIQKAPVEIQADLYKMVSGKHTAKVMGIVEKLGDNSYGYIQRLQDPLTGEFVITHHYKPVAGGYDDILTSEKEMLQEPFEVEVQRLKDKEQMESFDLQIKKMSAYNNQIINRSELKQLEENESYFKDPNKFEILQNKIDSNIKTLKSMTRTSKLDYINMIVAPKYLGTDADRLKTAITNAKEFAKSNPELALNKFMESEFGKKYTELVGTDEGYIEDPAIAQELAANEELKKQYQLKRDLYLDPIGTKTKLQEEAKQQTKETYNLYKLQSGKNDLQIITPKIKIKDF